MKNGKRNTSKGSYKGKGSSYSPKNRDIVKEDFKDKSENPSHADRKARLTSNSPAWYNKNPQLTQDVANFSFSQVTGLPQNWTGDLHTIGFGFDDNDKYYVPPIMKLTYLPTYGKSTAKSHALNVASEKFYSFIRHANSGSRNYEAPDLMLYIMAMDSAITLWAHALRTYGLLRTYSPNNRYLPVRIVETINGNFESFQNDMAQFRADINWFAAKLSSFNIPNTCDIIRRHMFMVSNVYMDQDSSKGQMYVFNPEVFYKFQPTKYESGGCLSATTYSLHNPAAYRTAFNDIINTLMSNEDIGLMSGDIQKAYGDQVFKFSFIDENYMVMPIHDQDILYQIHNATLVGDLNYYTDPESTHDSRDIYQSGGVIISNPRFHNTHISVWRDGLMKWANLLDIGTKNQATPEEAMYYSRLMVTPSNENLKYEYEGTSFELDSFASEVILTATLYYGSPGVLGFSKVFNIYSDVAQQTDTDWLAALTQFDWHPRTCQVSVDRDTGVTKVSSVFWETTNVGTISDSNMYALNDVAVLSLLDI